MKPLRELIDAAKAEGWTIDRTRRGHWRFRHPNGRAYVTSGTPSDHRSALNFRADLRRAGLSLGRGRDAT